jgi:hypothetical protein
MGVRLYNPTTGRFLTTDPVPGGNENTYNYPNDPINMLDLDGQFGFRRALGASVRFAWRHRAAIAAASTLFCSICAGVYAGYSIYRAAQQARLGAGTGAGPPGQPPERSAVVNSGA